MTSGKEVEDNLLYRCLAQFQSTLYFKKLDMPVPVHVLIAGLLLLLLSGDSSVVTVACMHFRTKGELGQIVVLAK